MAAARSKAPCNWSTTPVIADGRIYLSWSLIPTSPIYLAISPLCSVYASLGDADRILSMLDVLVPVHPVPCPLTALGSRQS